MPPVSRFEVLNADGVAPQFAGAFLIEDESVADDLVKEFHERPQLRGMVSNAANSEPVVDTSVKDSLEMSFPANDPSIAWRRYLLSLKAAMGLYLEDYPYAGAYGAFSITGRTNVQLYPPSGGYKTFHTERTGRGEPEGSRHLVFMTYLNDVTDAGGTEFCHQNLIVSPKKGLTLIWPADWTFTHRGVPSPTQEKIITTGWSRAASKSVAHAPGAHWSISAQVQFHVAFASKYTVLRLLLLFLAGGRFLLRGTLFGRLLRGPAPGFRVTPRRRRGGGRGLARLLGRLLSRGLRRWLCRGFPGRGFRHGLLFGRRLCRLAGRLLLFGGGRGPAARARAEPCQVVAARLVDGFLVTLELRRFVLEVQLLRVAARDVARVPGAVDLCEPARRTRATSRRENECAIVVEVFSDADQSPRSLPNHLRSI